MPDTIPIPIPIVNNNATIVWMKIDIFYFRFTFLPESGGFLVLETGLCMVAWNS